MDSLSIFVPGLPKTQGSMSHVGRGHMKHSKGLVAWRDDVARLAGFAHKGPLWDGPVAMEVVFHLRRPKKPANPEVPDHTLDLDKLVRAIGDALEKVVYTNDSRICGTAAAKVWAKSDLGPGVGIWIGKLRPGTDPLWWRHGPPL